MWMDFQMEAVDTFLGRIGRCKQPVLAEVRAPGVLQAATGIKDPTWKAAGPHGLLAGFFLSADPGRGGCWRPRLC